MSIATQARTGQDLARRAEALIPLLRRNAPLAEESRCLQPETVEALADAGVFRMRVPVRHGGYECDTRTLAEVVTHLGRGDGAVAWTTSVWTVPGWMVGMFPDPVQDEVYSTPDVRVCGTLSPGGSAAPVAGGYRVDGRWSFISGALHSHWQEIIAMAPTPDGSGMWPVVALVPLTDLHIVDDWHTSGLRGSGSVTTVAEDLFVPAERVIGMPALLQSRTASPANAELPLYRSPLVGVANASFAGVLLGMARAALEVFLERLPDRKITFSDYAHQADAPLTHLQVAEATMKIDEAGFHADRMTALVDAKGAAGEPWTMVERARTRADIGALCRLTREAVDLLAMASGGSSVYTAVPMQKIVRDMAAATLHPLMTPAPNLELYGRVLCGLEPNTQYI